MNCVSVYKRLLVKVDGEYLSSNRIVKMFADDKNHGIKARILCNDDTNNGYGFQSILRSQVTVAQLLRRFYHQRLLLSILRIFDISKFILIFCKRMQEFRAIEEFNKYSIIIQ